MPKPFILIRGGGDLGSGVAIRLKRAGFRVLITELAQPLSVRRLVCFSEAIFTGTFMVEGISAKYCRKISDLDTIFSNGDIAVMVDPDAQLVAEAQPMVWVDARMIKRIPDTTMPVAPLVLGLGPGFEAGVHCHAVIETNRGHRMGRVFWEGSTEPNTGMPEFVREFGVERVLRSPADGTLHLNRHICDSVQKGDFLCEVAGHPIVAPFDGVLRGILHNGQTVTTGLKIGDLDPRNDPALCSLVSDKALAVGGGVLEAILSRPEIRSALFCQDDL